MTTWEDINVRPEPVFIDATKCCVPAPVTGNPIDAFYHTTSHILTLGSPEQLSNSPTLGRLLVLGLVTSTEAYFRAVLLGATSICPLVRDNISDQQVAFGSVDFYGVDKMALGLFEGISFASGQEIKKRTKQITGLTWADTSSLGVAVNSFDQVCHMRHAAVHSHGLLNRGNARALGVTGRKGQLHVVVDLASLHLVAKACASLVKAYNLFLYSELLKRWLAEGLLSGDWKSDKALFGRLFELFRSVEDGIAPKSSYSAYKTILPGISKRLAAAVGGSSSI